MLCPIFVHTMKIMLLHQFILQKHVPYCPEQAPMGARSSSAGWVVTRRSCLNGSTIPVQGPTLDAKLEKPQNC